MVKTCQIFEIDLLTLLVMDEVESRFLDSLKSVEISAILSFVSLKSAVVRVTQERIYYAYLMEI